MLIERLKTLRLKAGLTQKEVAKQFEISQPAYAQWETGKIKPKLETVEKFANFFGVSTDYLLGNTDNKNPNELNLEKVKASLRQSLGFTGSTDIPEEELESMALAFIEHFGKE